MQRYLVVAAVALIAAFAVWHPAPRVAGVSAAAESAGPKQPRTVRSARTPAPLVIYVAGRVARPGLYRLAAGTRAADAVRAAGGLLADADPVAVNLAAPLGDGDEIAVPRAGAPTRRAARSSRRRAAQTAPPSLVDVNAAAADELARVPGIGPAAAARIVAVRSARGPFASLDELLDVAGMTPAKLDRAAPYLAVGR